MTTKEEIATTLIRYNHSVKILGLILDRIEEKNFDNNSWVTFSEKIGKKYLNQAFTLQQAFTNDLYIIKGNIEERFFDFSSIFSLLRVQLETYAVFYHLFIDNCSIEERIIRFRLWQLDGLKSRQTYSQPDDEELKQKLEKENEDIQHCISAIEGVNYFKTLEEKNKLFLLKFAAWRFTNESLKNKDNQKKKISINQMIMNTGLDKAHFDDWYSYTSTHTHTTYWSVVQNDSLVEQDKITMEYVALMQGTFITSFLIKDFCKIYKVAQDVFNALLEKDQKLINSFEKRGKNKL
ncbi:hypothetical protein I5M27_13915 [Adhaeribacter sp. BT258]|uniref:Cthe-2314-like HEPN domain-containing protein n=1 Tax=Adhaeribacter terrigena TaxID=2793070 RepID=A0ABS1C406_9BACT|nr:hypothetical protein [Adhaeribacter terrigena]MBK0404087.1 hypothetical protein [Adhaeribacter terrigena]